MNEPTNDDRAAWATEAVTAYTEAVAVAPADAMQAAHVGMQAAEAFARTTRNHPDEHTIQDAEHAREVIGDLMADLFHLADRTAAPTEKVTLAALADQAGTPATGTSTLSELVAHIQTRPATEAGEPTPHHPVSPVRRPIAETAVVTLLAAAVFYEINVPDLLTAARNVYMQEVEEERDEDKQPAPLFTIGTPPTEDHPEHECCFECGNGPNDGIELVALRYEPTGAWTLVCRRHTDTPAVREALANLR